MLTAVALRQAHTRLRSAMQSEEIVTESLDLVEVVAKYLHALSYLPACCTPPTISRKLAESQDVFQDMCHRAMVLRTLYSILQYSDVHSCDDQLKIVVECLLKALNDAAASTQDGARFCFQVRPPAIECCKVQHIVASRAQRTSKPLAVAGG